MSASSSATCIVTGGAGFIGCAISAGLVGKFSRVVAVDLLHPQIHAVRGRPAALHEAAELVMADITDSGTWDALLRGIGAFSMVHLAAETGTGQSLTESARHSHTNVYGTSVMLDAFARHEAIPERIVLCSSRAVYGEGAWRSLDGATVVMPGPRSAAQLARAEWDIAGCTALPSSAAGTAPNPASVYAATKLAQEHILRSWALAFGSRLVTLRLQNVYGPGQSLKNAYTGIVSLFCQLARQGLSIPLYEDGRMLRDFVFIDDIAAAILCAMDAEGLDGAALDVGTGQACSIAVLARLIARHYGAPEPHVTGKYRNGDVRHASCSIDRTIAALAWSPQVQPPEGLKRLADWIETQMSIAQ